MNSEEIEYERNMKIVKNAIATGRFYNMKICNCPVCKTECKVWFNPIERENIVICENCYSEYKIKIKRRKI